MLNVRTMPESSVGSTNGPGLLSLGLETLKSFLKPEEKPAKQSEGLSAVGGAEESLKMSVGDESGTETVSQECQISEITNLRIISLDEIAWHDTPDDCWFAIYDYVYDCTSFIKDHPGGDDVLLEYAGRDATLAFIGAGHSKFAQKMLERYLIGELPRNERIFRIDGGVKVYGV